MKTVIITKSDKTLRMKVEIVFGCFLSQTSEKETVIKYYASPTGWAMLNANIPSHEIINFRGDSPEETLGFVMQFCYDYNLNIEVL